ncbi:MAG: DNA-binding Lrp family transcriptional regulator [Oceanospirillaceae bacterium]|jgi:DNA-binding Lrp family transcriptional regulator
MDLEQRDKQLIALLKQNGRESVVSLSKKLGVSRATVQNRIEMLERRKIIKGFTVLFDDEYDKRLLRVLMSINLRAGVSHNVIKDLRIRPEVTKILSVSGIYDLVIEITVETTVELDFQIDNIREIEGIENTTTCVILADYH